MTDFLFQLAARTLGVAPVARPVVRPLHAPGPDTVELEVEAPVVQGASPAAPPVPAVAAPLQQQPFRPPERATDKGTPSGHEPARPIRRPDAARMEPTTAAPARSPRLGSKAEALRPAERKLASLAHAPVPPAPAPPATAGRPTAAALTAVPEPEAKPAAGPPVRALETEPQPLHAAATLVPAAAALPHATPSRVAQPAASLPPPVPGLEPRAAVEPQEPEIRISIGRIEVRAEAQSPEPADEWRPPALSLDEYLERGASR